MNSEVLDNASVSSSKLPSSWVAHGARCDVDVTRFRPVDKGSRSSGGQKVTADVVSRDGAFQYRLKSLNNPPHIKFLIPGAYSGFD